MDKPAINTHVRLFDLVRYMRGELHQADLITDEEYAWLCMEAPLAKGGGSPSPRRLEDYDDLRAKTNKLREALQLTNKWIEDNVTLTAGDHENQPEPADRFSYEAASIIMANRRALGEIPS